MSFVEPHFHRLLWLLQSEERDARYSAFEMVKGQLGVALKAVPFDYKKMMLLAKALYLLLYKEDRAEMQEKIAREAAYLIHYCPTLPEMQAILQADHYTILDYYNGEGECEHAIEEYFEGEEGMVEAENADLEMQQIKDYAGFQTLFFRCFLETFCREFDRVDYLRQSKFLLLVRRMVEEMLICGFLDADIQQLKCFIQTLCLVCLDEGRLKALQCPRSLVYHLIDIYTDCLHYACKSALPDPDYFAIAVAFWGETLVTLYNEPEIKQHILTRIFDDFTELSFYGDESFANYIRSEKESEDQPTLADCFWVLAVYHPEYKDDLEEFAYYIEEFVDWWNSDESSKYRENRERGLKLEEKEYQEYIHVIYEEAVRIAKYQKGDDWEKYINKQQDEWEYDPKWPNKAMRIENIYLEGYQKKEDDL